MLPLEETTIYARANGYVRSWRVDIGAHVKKGEVLAVLEVPDLEEELGQARAAAAQAKAGIDQASTQLSWRTPPTTATPRSARRASCRSRTSTRSRPRSTSRART
jgi:multidrug efflux pump subunit AcrA (membrane-fusion protein)